MINLTDLHKDILISCADDYTDLSTIVNVITEAGTKLMHLRLEELQDTVLGIIKDLLDTKLIQAGDLDSTGTRLNPWFLNTNEIIDRIRKEWNNHIREGVPWPDPWEIVCFVSTVEGDRVLAERQERNALKEPGA